MITRGLVLRAMAAIASMLPAQSPAANRSPKDRECSAILPMERCGGGFCVPYMVDRQELRAVVDTGSPFLLVDGTCQRNGRFGCFTDEQFSVSLGDRSTEGFAGQEVQVDWRRGEWSIGGGGVERSGRFTGLRFSPINFGVVRGSIGSGGTQAIYLGLIKDRQPRVRPTLLEQTDIRTLDFDFPRRTLTVSRCASLTPKDDAVPLVDLRPVGALGKPLLETRIGRHTP